MKKNSNEHQAQRPKWYQLALRCAAAVAIFIGTVWWLHSVLVWFAMRTYQGKAPALIVAEIMQQPGLLLLFTGYFGLLFLDARDSRLPRNPAPGELWQWRVNRAMRLLRGKWWAVSCSVWRSDWRRQEKADELTLRLERLTSRYFPSSPPPPPRRYRKLSDY